MFVHRAKAKHHKRLKVVLMLILPGQHDANSEQHDVSTSFQCSMCLGSLPFISHFPCAASYSHHLSSSLGRLPIQRVSDN